MKTEALVETLVYANRILYELLVLRLRNTGT
jgi:hypothetical protein